jgi:hypothetical protein
VKAQVTHIPDECVAAHAVSGEFGRRRARRCDVAAAMNRNVKTARGKGKRDAASNSAGRACDECGSRTISGAVAQGRSSQKSNAPNISEFDKTFNHFSVLFYLNWGISDLGSIRA